MKTFKLSYLLFWITSLVFSQHEMQVEATLLDDSKTLSIQQQINFKNETGKPLEYIYLYDWINAFSDKKSALGQCFSEEFVRKFHFAGKDERGGTTIKNLKHNGQELFWKRPVNYPDVVQIKLDQALADGHTFTFEINYLIKAPDAKFTNFGFEENQLKLKYWLLKPAFYKNRWFIYSHRRLFDMPQQVFDIKLKFNLPSGYDLTTSFKGETVREIGNQKIYDFPKQSTVDTDIYIQRKQNFDIIKTDFSTLVTNIESDDLQAEIKSIIAHRILEYLDQNLGSYPFENILVSEEDYQTAPVYGLNQLPAFIRPFPDGFQYDIKLIKALTAKYLKNTILINTRQDKWMLDAIQISLIIDYVNTYYPKMKLLGKLSDFYVIKWFHVADLDFNDQYDFLYKNVTRNNLQQSLNTPQDSLIKFNQKIANPYQAGLGMNFLKHYTSRESVSKGIQLFYKHHKLQFSEVKDFKNYLSQTTEKNIDWFFEDYTNLKSPIDFKIKSLKRENDSLKIKIINRNKTKVPVSLFWLKDKKVIDKTWIEPFDSIIAVKVARKSAQRVGLNHDAVIPEVNKRNNYKGVTKLFNKPIQVRLLEDVEDPKYNQLFVMPEFSYNLYDGISIGPKLYNGTFLPRQFDYKLSPKYGFNSGALVGSASINYTSWQYNKDLFGVKMGINGSRFSYNFDLFFERYSGFLTLMYRNNKDRRSNKRQFLTLRTVNVRRDRDITNTVDDPDYNVFNARYTYQNKNLDRFFVASIDYEIAQKFSKIFATATFRRLYENNRQINVRLFLGTFLFNDTRDSDFFSFALDRPSDYMFDLNYYGRSEESGLFSQQFIMAEGGFKSQLEPDFANEWLATFNTSTTIWNWIFAYADAGLVGNKYNSPKFLYDSGIRLNLVEDYFELYFPVYSNKGWEFNEPNYDENIRFIVSLDFQTLFRLFTRRWY
ncbi:MAG: metalloprotease [Bacteroidetes bacterium]|nr:metalloprotease [Bacteroidota bacterium]